MNDSDTRVVIPPTTSERGARPQGLTDEWLWGWDPTPGIVSVWADMDGRASIWRREPASGRLTREQARFRPWVLLDFPLESAIAAPGASDARGVTCRELEGPGALRFLASADTGQALASEVLVCASRRAQRHITHLRDLGKTASVLLPPEEQYLVATGRTYFRDLAYDQVQRLQFDLETTGLHADRDRIFLIAVRDPAGRATTLEADGEGDAAEADLIQRFVALVQRADPDVIENHNLHGFDLPFLHRRAARLGVPLALGRIGPPGFRTRPAQRGVSDDRGTTSRKFRYVVPGRELIDTMDAVLRHAFSARDLPGHGLKAVARHFGIAGPDREYIRGGEVAEVYRRDPDRVRRYAIDDVNEVAALSRLLGGAAFALARMAPRRYERLADAGAATGVIDPLLVRAYLRAGKALPAHEEGDGTPHSGAALHLFAAGVAHRVVKADVASLYPSLMRAFAIGPARDHLGALLALVDGLVERRLAAKADARRFPTGSAERFTHEAMSAALKIVVNSAYGYLAAGGALTRFADVHAANEVTRRGRETLDLLCRELAARGVMLLEADTDGVYFAVPDGWTEADERRVVAEVGALLPPLVQLEFEGRYRAMLSHEPKNYALLSYDGELLLRGVGFRSSRAEPYGEAFLRRAIGRLLVDDVAGVREAFHEVILALHRREVPTREVSSLVRLTKSPREYREVRDERHEASYEAVLSSGRTTWRANERIRIYRATGGSWRVVGDEDPRDYDVAHYVRVLRDTFAQRLSRAFHPDDVDDVFDDPTQPGLFPRALDDIRPCLTPMSPPG